MRAEADVSGLVWDMLSLGTFPYQKTTVQGRVQVGSSLTSTNIQVVVKMREKTLTRKSLWGEQSAGPTTEPARTLGLNGD